MLGELSGRKALIMDKETLSKTSQNSFIDIVSLVYSRTQILQKEVFFIETLDKIPEEKLTHLKAVFFCRPIEDSVQRICREL